MADAAQTGHSERVESHGRDAVGPGERGGCMSEFWGCDTEALRAFASVARGHLSTLDRTAALVQLAATSSDIWAGADAEIFREAASGRGLSSCTEAARLLDGFAGLAEENADEQDLTSEGESETSAMPIGALDALTVGLLPILPSPRPEEGPRAGRESGREDDRRGEDDPAKEPPGGTLGTGLPDGLGTPVPGTSVPDPGMTEWHPVDPGAGEWGSERPTLGDVAQHEMATHAAAIMSAKWPDASANLLHFLANSGQDKEMDLDSYLQDETAVRQQIEARERAIGEEALRRANANGSTGPVTFPVQTGWPGVTASSRNWFYATGSGNYSMHGQVTVYPPDAEHPNGRYEMNTTLEYRDQYNWDGSKSTTIDLPGPFDPTITDQQLAELHRAGLAKEYTLHGAAARRTTGP